MRMKCIAVFLILATILIVGCIGEEETAVPEATPTENATETPTEVVTPTETPTEVVTPTETPTEVATPTEMATPTEEPTSSPEPKKWTIRLQNFLATPSTLEVNKGDTVVWMNFNDPIRQFILLSKDGLWEDKTINYRYTFVYTFNETGTYNYTVLGYEERMSGSVIVK